MLVLLTSDGCFDVKNIKCKHKIGRFFNIVKNLPLELVMVVINRLRGSSKDLILTKTLNDEINFNQCNITDLIYFN